MRELLLTFLLAGPLALLAAVGGGYVLAGRALQPVQSMTQTANRITADRLHERIVAGNPACRQDAGVQPATHERVQICDLLADVVSNMQLLAEERNVRLTLDANPPCLLSGDSRQLRRVFYNLLDNAVKYTPAGGTVSVTGRSENGEAQSQSKARPRNRVKEHTPHVEGTDGEPVPFRDAFRVWCRVDALSFGGPAGQIAVMHRVLVDEKKWISEERFLHALNYCMLLPGPEAQQLATYIGWLLHRTLGGLVAGVLFILPGFVSILGLSILYAVYQQTDFVQAVFFGLKPAVLAIVVEAVLRISKRVLKNGTMITLAAASFVAIFFFNVPFPLLILGAGLIGFIRGERKATPGERGPAFPAPAALLQLLSNHARSNCRARR